MTTPDIAALRGLLEKATPGEWRADYYCGGSYIISRPDGDLVNNDFRETFSEADARLIVAMKTALPSLLSTIEGQAEEIERLRGALGIGEADYLAERTSTELAAIHGGSQ